MDDWDNNGPAASNDFGGSDFTSSGDVGGGKSFGKGRGFKPQGVDNGSDFQGGRGGRGGRGNRGSRGGGRFDNDRGGGGYRGGNRDRNGDDSWGNSGGGGGGNSRNDNWGSSDNDGDRRGGGGRYQKRDDESGGWGSGGGRSRDNDDDNGGGGGYRNNRGGGAGFRNNRRRDDDNEGGGWGSGGGGRSRDNDDNGGDGWGGSGGRSRDNDDNGGGWSNDNRDGGRGGRGRDRDGGRGRDRDNDNGGGFGSNDGENEGEKRPPIYVPKDITEEELEGQGIGVGINFKDYDNIKVNVSGENAPKPIQSFEQAGLRSLIIDNLKYFKYTNPTPVQKHAIPIVLEKRDLMATAQTGSGKTAAFLLPIIDYLLQNSDDSCSGGSSCSPRALILSPTRELTTQIYMEAKKFARNSYLKIAQIYGGTATSYQSKKLLEGCDILVATPGRMGDFLNRNHITLSNLRFFILDEADRMLDMGFRSDIEKFFTHESISPREERQTLMFSATFSQEIQRMAHTYLNDYVFLAVGIVGGACKDVEQIFIQAERREKQKKLLELLKNERCLKGTLVFVETKRTADFTASYLSEQDFPTTSIHGDRFQEQRETALREFKSGAKDILVATSVAARGLDIKGVKHVVNFDLPKDIDEYVHRIGRTGRLGNKGKATSFYDSSNDNALACSLVNILEQANQPVPDWLKNDATGASSYNQNEFGAQDYRSKQQGAFQTGAEPTAIESGAAEESW